MIHWEIDFDSLSTNNVEPLTGLKLNRLKSRYKQGTLSTTMLIQKWFQNEELEFFFSIENTHVDKKRI